MVTAGRIAKNTTYLTSAIVVQKILAFIFFTLIARMAGVENLGKYTFVLSFTTIFSTFIDTGLTPVLIREVAKAPHYARKYLGNIITVKIFLGIFLYAVVISSSFILGHDRLTRELLFIASAIMVMDSFTLSFYGIFRALQKLKIESIGMIGSEVVVVIVGIAALFLKWPLHALVGAVLCGSFFNFGLSFWQVAKNKLVPRFQFDRKFIKATFLIAIPFALSGIFTRLYGSLDTVLLSHMVSDAAVGLYSVANKFAFSLQFIPMAFIAAIYPAMSHYYMHSREKLRRTFENALLIMGVTGIPIAFGIFSIAREIIFMFYGREYGPSILALQILIFSLMFIFLQFPIGSLLNACDKQKLNMSLMGITAVLNIVLNLLLIPPFEHTGAAVAFLISYSFLFTSGFIAARRTIDFDFLGLTLRFAKLIVAGGIMAIAVLLVKPYTNIFFDMIIGAAVYIAALFITRSVDIKEACYFVSMIRRKEGKTPLDL